jgi:hypothetical protein
VHTYNRRLTTFYDSYKTCIIIWIEKQNEEWRERIELPLRSNSNHISISFLYSFFFLFLTRSSMFVQACICPCVCGTKQYIYIWIEPMLLHSLVCSLSFSLSPYSPPLSSMSMLTNCTYPTSPWCEGHRTHTHTYIQQWRSSLYSHHVFFLLSLNLLFFFHVESHRTIWPAHTFEKKAT